MNASNLEKYYNLRASFYEKIYDKPERQPDLSTLKSEIENRLKNFDVLEVACGTGYWTKHIAQSASSILGVDQSSETLGIARGKNIPRTRFLQDDAYNLEKVSGNFSAGFAGFWWSHIPKKQLCYFLKIFHSKLDPGARVIFIDNNYVKGSSSPITRTDEHGNTYQTRILEDNSSHEIIKNFPDELELRQTIATFSTDIEIIQLQYYWLLQYRSHPMD